MKWKIACEEKSPIIKLIAIPLVFYDLFKF